jgi:predicted ferric reductase
VTSEPTFWLVTRSSGIVCYLLVTASVVAGLVVKSRPFRGVKPAAAVDVHRFLSLLAVAALGVHMATLVLDEAVPVSIQALFAPGMLEYRTAWSALGVVSGELMLVVVVSFWLRRWIGARRWRTLHWTTYVVFVGATVHGLLTGTDTERPWAVAIYLGACAAVVVATLFRVLFDPATLRPVSRPARAPSHTPDQAPGGA